MNDQSPFRQPFSQRIDELFRKLLADAEAGGYHLNPDEEFTRELVESLIVNTDRYRYPSCPCRLAAGSREQDLDIICPCDYRDPDLSQFGACYCALYVSAEIAEGKREARSIPERRPSREERGKADAGTRGHGDAEQRTHAPTDTRTHGLTYPVWRCKVCGYLCARDEPPEACPICKADKDRFERFL